LWWLKIAHCEFRVISRLHQTTRYRRWF